MDDALLSLEEDAVEVRRALMQAGFAIWQSVLAGQGAPVGRYRFERMREPQPGDWVVEITSRNDRATDWYRGFGRLVSADVESGAYVVRYGPDEIDRCTWHNACFIALPIADATWWNP